MKTGTCLGGVVAASLLLSACVTDGPYSFAPSAPDAASQSKGLVYDSIDQSKLTSEPRRLAATGVKALDEGDLELALKSFNQALKLNMTDSTLNFLTGLTYHLMAVKGDESKYALAEEGYKLAIKFDNSNWYAYFQSGLLAMDQRKFIQAQSRFSEALIYNNADQDLLYSMLVASYYAGDIRTTAVMRDRLKSLEPSSPRLLKASVITSAALDKPDEATRSLAQLAAVGVGKHQVDALKRRMADWRTFHKNKIQLAQSWQDTIGSSPPSSSTTPPAPSAAPTQPVTSANQSSAALEANTDQTASQDVDASTPTTAPKQIDQNGMVIVDVTIIRTQEDITTSKGVNLLNGLQLQFGDGTGTGTSGLLYKSAVSKAVGSTTNTITRAINIPAITYSLNIANVNDTRNEILARPTLTATNGSQSKFFSGIHIQAATLPTDNNGAGGDSVTFDDDVGVKLSVTPTLLDDGRVKMDVSAERKFLNTPDASYTGFTSKLESTRTTVSATVAMEFGETLILSGLSDKETQKNKDGVPLLQDIPVIQYLFSNKTTTDSTKSVLVLLTPRQPQYTYRRGKSQTGSLGENEALSELRARHVDWFDLYPASATIFNHMQNNHLFRELRTGDVSLERWESHDTFWERLKTVLGFLYY